MHGSAGHKNLSRMYNFYKVVTETSRLGVLAKGCPLRVQLSSFSLFTGRNSGKKARDSVPPAWLVRALLARDPRSVPSSIVARPGARAASEPHRERSRAPQNVLCIS